MKKIMEQVLQESAKVYHISNPKKLKQPKINLKEVVAFLTAKQNELEDITKNTKP